MQKENLENNENLEDNKNLENTENNDNPEDSKKESPENDDNSTDTENKDSAEKEALEKKAADYLSRYQRTLAEFDNFRKRTLKEKANMYDDGIRDSVLKLIPVIDNFERAVTSVSDDEKQSALFKGIEMVLKQFMEILSSLGVEEIEAEGKTFDPNFHNAIMHIEDDNFGENEVAEVLQKGYICKDKVIRPSMVKVAN